MGNALLWNVWKLNIGKNGGFLYCFVFYICFVSYSTENTVSLVEKYTRPKKSFFFSTDHLFWNSDSYWYLGSQVWEAKPRIVEAFNGVLTTSWYEREVVLLGILVMLLGSNLKSLVPYKCSAQSCFCWRSGAECLVCWHNKGDAGQSNQCTETVFKQQNGAPDAFLCAMSASGEPPTTLFFFFSLCV